MKLLLLTGTLLLLVWKHFATEQKPVPQCTAVALTVSLEAGDDYRRRINDLTFMVKATKDKEFCSGWMFSLEDTAGHDFIYPVNPPLRFNPSQVLGCGYGQTARESLKIDRELRFLLNESDYEHIDPLLRNALWPAEAPEPNRAAEEYLTALDKLTTGWLRLKILRSEVALDGTVRSAEVQVELIAPSDFLFDPTLEPYSTACSPRSSP